METYLLTAPLCSCRWATRMPLGRQLSGGGLASHMIPSTRSRDMTSASKRLRWWCTQLRRSHLHCAKRLVTGGWGTSAREEHKEVQSWCNNKWRKRHIKHPALFCWNTSKDAQCKAQYNKMEENKRKKLFFSFFKWGVGGGKCINNSSPHPQPLCIKTHKATCPLLFKQEYKSTTQGTI